MSQTDDATRSTIFRNLALLSLSLLVSCLMLEAVVRAAIRVLDRPPLVVRHEIAGWTSRPNLHGALVSVGGIQFRTTTDSLGRRITHDSPRASDTSRAIALVGDSFVYGLNVNDQETFAWKLADDFPHREVANLGVPGYGTCQQLVSVEEYFKSAPRGRVGDLVVVVFENDFLDVQRPFDSYLGRSNPVYRIQGRQLDRGAFRLSSLDRLMDYSRLVWLFRSKLASRRAQPAINGDAGENLVLSCLWAIRRLAETNGARVHVYAHRRTARASSVHDAVWSDFLERSGALDITDVFRASPGQNPIGPDGAHWNAEGHRRAAAIIRQTLRPR